MAEMTIFTQESPEAIACEIRQQVEKRMLKPPEHPFVLEFENVPPDLIAESLYNPLLFGADNLRIFYDEDDQQRLKLKIPSTVHNHAERRLTLEIERATIYMGLEDSFKRLGGGRVTFEKISKEPDSSFRPVFLPPGRPKKWPTIIVETGNSESLQRLRNIANLWISHSDGMVKVVVLLSVDRRRIAIEKWIPEHRDNNGVVAVREQDIVISKDENDKTVVGGAGLTLRFEEMFLHEPFNEAQNDCVMLPGKLKGIAESVWREMD